MHLHPVPLFNRFLQLRSTTNKDHKLVTSTKRSFNSNLILNFTCNPRLFWKTINSLLHCTPTSALPTAPLTPSLSQLFSTFFSDNVSKLHLKLLSAPSPMPPHFFSPTTIPRSLDSFTPTSVTVIFMLIFECTNSYCDIDPIPTILLKLLSPSI